MLLRTHFIIAVLFLLLLQPVGLLFGIGFILATFFVDIDSKKSRMGNHWYLRPVQWIVSHRGAFHTLLFASLISAVIYFFNNFLGIGFFVGYILHLFLDCLTMNGVKLFWPISNIKISFFVKSGGLLEEIIFVLVLLADIFIAVKMFF